ncbi:Filamentation induced by cAMP protein Fic [Desulfamplus magnetovallimortis]|uniref:Filamentation induced by cAMP protein Fic n=1 Tax=Desulfamplus magnetovallimortis TaxID=1246637 RepID=A0A1W1HCS8_9BACT|nr:Fic family protein [Desulfamplus magnetovallimortis]SLM30284.1 Filamentation induced by cAMP protein Fic [Desulfamplus magnetovallimortis]
MPRKIFLKEFEIILKVISDYPEGIGISKLEQRLSPLLSHINRRSLQRRLKNLVEQGDLQFKGNSTARVYQLKQLSKSKSPNGIENSVPGILIEPDIPLSPDGKIIQEVVRQPLMKRRPMGYHRSFLEDYEPGVMFYLPVSLREQFHEMGRTSAAALEAGTYARDVLSRLMIDLSWASSRLEGNTYNHLDTIKLIEFGQAAEGKDVIETQMILNHKAAIEMLIHEIDEVGFNPFTFLNLHAVLSENLLHDETACGRIRKRPVDISGSVYHPTAMPQVLEDCFRLLLKKAEAIPDPFEQSFFIMVQLPYLQPFEDVNKRVSRLGANLPLIKNNLCPLSFMDVPEKTYVEALLGVYELNQVDLLVDLYTWAYERSCQRYLSITQTMKEPDPLRIRYRDPLIRVIQSIVRNRKSPTNDNIASLVDQNIREEDRAAFIQMVKDALTHLHEGSVARYRLKLSEYQSWKMANSPA